MRPWSFDVWRLNESNQPRATLKLNGANKQAAAQHTQQDTSTEWAQRVLSAQNAVDAMDKLRAALPGSERKSFSATLKATLGKTGQTGCIGARSMRNTDDAVVAGHLALLAKAALNQEKRGIERKQDQA